MTTVRRIVDQRVALSPVHTATVSLLCDSVDRALRLLLASLPASRPVTWWRACVERHDVSLVFPCVATGLDCMTADDRLMTIRQARATNAIYEWKQNRL